ncbi:MAG: PAS domain S-box protein [Desulfobacteraceae bacterium]|nr:PAS domain S-box protein [Desulfobacteraceae bacterium]
MFEGAVGIYRSLISRLIVLVGLVLSVSIFIWAYFNINYQKESTLQSIIESCDRLGNTIRLGTHYAMMLNSRNDLDEITRNIGSQEGIDNIRIYNKQGQIKFSSLPGEVDQTTSIKAEACDICHRTDPPLKDLAASARTRILRSPDGHRQLGIISPIYNEPSCASEACHVHPPDKTVLGALDVVVSLKETDRAIRTYEERIIILAVISFLATSAIIVGFLLFFVNRPIRKLIAWTRNIAEGEYRHEFRPHWVNEIGQLAHAIDAMAGQIDEKQEELNRQRNEYQELFEQVPCYITVQDRELTIVRYNREFARAFDPRPGGRCYEIYKGRKEVCQYCPVLKTFADGESHLSEEAGTTADGKASTWICRTSPLKDSRGEISAVMEMSVDVTERKALEEEIVKSEKKYREIFNNIPNPLFVLDRELKILDCNEMVFAVYGYEKSELLGEHFRDILEGEQNGEVTQNIKRSDALTNVRHVTKDGRAIYVNIRISPSEYLGRDAFLVTTSDITKRLMAEQHLIQASKMATLGEMATAIAHELNQPLSVMKTASSFLVRKISRSEPIREDVLKTMAAEIDSHVDRASCIINHLREFGRKSEVERDRVDVNEALEKALQIFMQQLKLRKIEVEKNLAPDLPPVLASSNRLEQVFINLLINARDAIEDRCEKMCNGDIEKRVSLKTLLDRGKVRVEVSDTGTGISKSVLDKIFEPFFTTKRVGRGTGLGLSISYGIVQDYEGTIEVETRENEGATFIIRFPAAGEA